MGWFGNLMKGTAEDILGGAVKAGYDALTQWQRFQYGEKAADAADERHRKQFEDLYSIEAQMEQAKKAGLSPSMFFGGTPSQGGASTPQGTGSSGPIFNSRPIDTLQAAQVDALEEETRGKKIENDNKQAEIDADIAMKLSQAGLNKASEAYTNTQNMRAQIAARIEGATEGIEIEKAMSEADKMYWESYLAQYNARDSKQVYEFNLETYQTRVNQVKAEYSKLLVDTKEGKSRIQLNQATIDNMADQIAVACFNAKVGEMSVKAQEKWYKEQIEVQLDKLEQEKVLTEAQIKAMKQGQWLNFATDVFGSICNLAGSALRAAAPK